MASYTKQDAVDAMRYAEARESLHLLNRVVALFPQVFTHLVVEIAPAAPQVDYRFDRSFADHAILLRIDWHRSGKGCVNAACYATYPKGKMCDAASAPTVFVTGDGQTVTACQPACFMRRRAFAVLRRVNATGTRANSFTDDNDPRRCVECDLLNEVVTKFVVRRRLDAGYDVWRRNDDDTDEQPVHELPASFRLRDADVRDGVPYPNADTGLYAWNREENRCEQMPDHLYRFVVEPYWRDPSHSICRSTNFRIGETVVEPYYSSQMQDPPRNNPNLVGFLQRNSPTYCRAFDKLYDEETGECVAPWWEDALTYTLLGEGILRLLRNAVQGEVGCMDDAWVPQEGELSRDADPRQARTLNEWRGDVDLDFVVPPPNVTLLDLEIDPLVTGNRLYWNNREGVLSRMALFRDVESFVAAENDDEDDDDWTSLYRNYNDTSETVDPWSGPLPSGTASVRRVPELEMRVRERCIGLMSDVADRIGAPSGKFRPEDVQRFVDTIDETMNENQMLAILRELGLSITGDVAVRFVVKTLKATLKRTLQFLVRNMEGRVAGALMRTGMRTAMSRIVGAAVSQMTLRLIAIGGTAATGVGIVVSAVELLSFVVDMAILFGWDPGNYRAYTSTASFRQLMDGSFRGKILEDAYNVTPLLLAQQLMRATSDDTDKSSSAANNAGGTADAKVPDTGSLARSLFELYDAPDLRVTRPRWYNKQWTECFPSDQTSLHTRKGRDLLVERVPLDDDPAMWTTIQDLFFLGSLTTNSLGQLVNLDEQTDEIGDADLVDAAEQADYRELGTISTHRDVDATTYNKRATFTATWTALFAGAGTVAVAWSAFASYAPLLWLGMTMLCLAAIVTVLGVFLPVEPDSTARIEPDRVDETNRTKLSDVVDEATLRATLSGVVAAIQSLLPPTAEGDE